MDSFDENSRTIFENSGQVRHFSALAEINGWSSDHVISK